MSDVECEIGCCTSYTRGRHCTYCHEDAQGGERLMAGQWYRVPGEARAHWYDDATAAGSLCGQRDRDGVEPDPSGDLGPDRCGACVEDKHEVVWHADGLGWADAPDGAHYSLAGRLQPDGDAEYLVYRGGDPLMLGAQEAAFPSKRDARAAAQADYDARWRRAERDRGVVVSL